MVKIKYKSYIILLYTSDHCIIIYYSVIRHGDGGKLHILQQYNTFYSYSCVYAVCIYYDKKTITIIRSAVCVSYKYVKINLYKAKKY